jgi:hypothetical protein
MTRKSCPEARAPRLDQPWSADQIAHRSVGWQEAFEGRNCYRRKTNFVIAARSGVLCRAGTMVSRSAMMSAVG